MISVATPETTPPSNSHQVTSNSHLLVDDDKTFIFRSKLPDIAIPDHLPLHSYCFERISEYADRTCLISGSNGRIYTYAETHLLSQKTAAGLSRLGIKQGDVIMILLQNCPEFVFSFMGASMLGAVTTTANPFYTTQEIYKQLSASDAKLIITQSHYIPKILNNVSSASPKLKLGQDFALVTIDDYNGDGNADVDGIIRFSEMISGKTMTTNEDDAINKLDQPAVSIDLDDPVALPFSSGTTGLPKGVILTHKSLISSIAQQVDGDNPNLYLKSDDIVLCVLPLFHIFSLHSVLLCSLRAGAGVMLMQKFEIVALLELIQKYRISVAPVVPPLVLALAKNPAVDSYDLSSIRIVLSGAAPLGKELEHALKTRLPKAIFGQGYGMTEVGPVLSMCSGFAKQPFPSKSGSCGMVVRNAQLKIIDPETGKSLGRNQAGEICIRGPQIMKGYLNDPEATASTIDIEGWLHTGDIGYVDDDDEVFIVDRVKELIKFKGFQVPPAELEALLVGHQFIADAAVVARKDTEAGEVPIAFVVRTTDCELITEEDVKEFIAKQVVFYKRLHKVHFIHAIPRSPAGKILRKDLRAKLEFL